MQDRWEGIDAFAAIAETGSFTRAAARLGVSVSHISREIGRLESRLGIQLLARTTRRLAITEAGKQFDERCRRMIADRDAAFEALASGQASASGHIRLTCPVSYGEKMIVPILARFLHDFPRISVDIELTNRLLDIRSEGFDLGIRIDDQPDARIERTRLGSRTLHCCATPDYLTAHGVPVAVSDLNRHQCLQGSSEYWRFRSNNRDFSIRPHSRWRCNSGVAVLEATMQGLGICQLPDFYVEAHLRDGTLAEILTDSRPKDQDIWAVHPKGANQQRKLMTLIDYIRAGLNG